MKSESALRRVVLAVTVGSFSIAALVGVVALLAGGGFGEAEVKVLLTTLIVGSASVCVLCYLATGDTPYRAVGAAGGVVVILPVGTALLLVWREWDISEPSEMLLKGFGVGTVLALTLAQASMLLGVAWSAARVRWLLWSTLAAATALASLVSWMILAEESAGDIWRLVGVIAILDVLGTVVTVALAKFGRDSESPPREAGPASRIALSGELAARLAARAAESGRPAAVVLDEAVRSYLDDDRSR